MRTLLGVQGRFKLNVYPERVSNTIQVFTRARVSAVCLPLSFIYTLKVESSAVIRSLG